MTFVNLHAHSHYSLLDGFGSPKNMVKRAKDLGCPAVALTDHGVTYGLIELYTAAESEGIKPILGCELYVAPRSRFSKDVKLDTKPYHLTILAENNIGYQNLLKLVTQAHLEGFYYKPRVDYGLLKAHSEGLIALSGCLAGHIPRAILSGDDKLVDELIHQYIDIFGRNNFFLEMQDNPLLDNQAIVNKGMKLLSKKYDLPLVVTNDSHYACPKDSDAHDIMLCIQTGTTVNDTNRMRYTGDFSIRDVSELREAFSDCPEAIDNTVKIADRCNVSFEFGINLIPSFATPQNEAADLYLKQLCEDGLKARFNGSEVPPNYVERLEYELNMVHDMGFDTYFLIVHDFIDYARKQKIIVGPGRGSAAGSIISWSLRITDVDPIFYGLFFERFLNPERVSMPDIDIDFADSRRDEVIAYVVQKYGRENVAQIITFGTMAPKAAVRDVGRALGYPYQEVDQLAKTVPPPVLGKHVALNVSIKEDSALSEVYKNDARAKYLLDYAQRLEGTVRHIGTHACAVVISEKPLTTYTALQYGAGSGGEIVTQYSAKPLENLGLLKMDFLGLRNLTVIEKTKKLVQITRDEEINIESLPFDDEKTFELFKKGDTTGVFQFESPGIRRYLKELKPSQFEDVVAMGALYRPGPMEWIPNYIKGKHKPKTVQYLHKSFKKILENTYGVAIYQEQILQLARDFAGFSLGQADLLRKAVGKKIPSLLAEQRERFIEGAVKGGHDKKFAREVFEKVIEPFAGYGFNRAHAVCYGVIAYQTAYLKAHYPIEFMTALLCSDAANTDRVILEIKECCDMGIDILGPSVNESFADFTVIDSNKIRFGLLAIKGVGEGPVNAIIDERKANGPFKSLADFASRAPSKVVNKKLIQSFAYSGAFDDFGDRNQIAESYDEISKFSKYSQETFSNGQTDIFGMMEEDSDMSAIDLSLRPVPLSNALQRVKWEKEFLGMYVSGHPLRGLSDYISTKARLISSISKRHLSTNIRVVGLISEYRQIQTKSGGQMAIFTIEDSSARVNVVAFPKIFAKYSNVLQPDAIIAMSGKFDHGRGQYQIICESAKLLSIDAMIDAAKQEGFYNADDKSGIAIRSLDDILSDSSSLQGVSDDSIYLIKVPSELSSEKLKAIKDLLIKHKGDVPVEVYLEASDKKILLPFKVDLSDFLKEEVLNLLTI